MTKLYTGKAHARGGRNGSVRTDDGSLDIHLAAPPAMGGSGPGTNPEQLFAAGYAACFASTLTAIAQADGTPVKDVAVDAEVDIVLEHGNYDLAVRLFVTAGGTDSPTLDALIAKAKQSCPYSRATFGRVETVVRAAP
jgi:Ohr subfamily peroxiredoxin